MSTHPKQLEGILKRSPAVELALSEFELFQTTRKVEIKVSRIDRKFLDSKAFTIKTLQKTFSLIESVTQEDMTITCVTFLLGSKNREILSRHDHQVEEFAIADAVTWDGKTVSSKIPISGILSVAEIIPAKSSSLFNPGIVATLRLAPREAFKIEDVPTYHHALCIAGEDERENYFLGCGRRDPGQVWQSIYANVDRLRINSAHWKPCHERNGNTDSTSATECCA